MAEKLVIIWTETAQEDLDLIYRFLLNYSKNAAEDIVRKILNEPKILKKGFEYIGAVDDINPKYRRLIVGNYKILYSVQDSNIYINAIFDCRQNPEKLKDL